MIQFRHDIIAALMHWAHAGLVFCLLALGWMMTALPKGAEKAELMALHKSLGVCALLLIVLRFIWRVRHRLPSPKGGTMELLARTNQRMLYFLLFLVPGFGLLGTAFGKFPLRFFVFDLPKPFPPCDTLHRLFTALHAAAAWVLAGLIALHLLAAIHHFISRNGAASRMPSVRPWV